MIICITVIISIAFSVDTNPDPPTKEHIASERLPSTANLADENYLKFESFDNGKMYAQTSTNDNPCCTLESDENPEIPTHVGVLGKTDKDEHQRGKNLEINRHASGIATNGFSSSSVTDLPSELFTKKYSDVNDGEEKNSSNVAIMVDNYNTVNESTQEKISNTHGSELFEKENKPFNPSYSSEEDYVTHDNSNYKQKSESLEAEHHIPGDNYKDRMSENTFSNILHNESPSVSEVLDVNHTPLLQKFNLVYGRKTPYNENSVQKNSNPHISLADKEESSYLNSFESPTIVSSESKVNYSENVTLSKLENYNYDPDVKSLQSNTNLPVLTNSSSLLAADKSNNNLATNSSELNVCNAIENCTESTISVDGSMHTPSSDSVVEENSLATDMETKEAIGNLSQSTSEEAKPVAEDIPNKLLTEEAKPLAEDIPNKLTTEEAKPVVEDVPNKLTTEEAKPLAEDVPNKLTTEEAKPVAEDVPNKLTTEEAKPLAEDVPNKLTTEEAKPLAEDVPNKLTTEEAKPLAEDVPNKLTTEEAKPLAEDVPNKLTTEEAKPLAEDVPNHCPGPNCLDSEVLPVQLSPAEQKFLIEASALLAAPVNSLDHCQHEVVIALQKSCKDLSQEEIGKFAVRLLNCQSHFEKRKTFVCNDGMVSLTFVITLVCNDGMVSLTLVISDNLCLQWWHGKSTISDNLCLQWWH